MATHDDETNSKRHREDEADRTPDEGPEGSRDKDSERGKSGVAAINVGLEIVAGNNFEDCEDSCDEDGVFPTVEDGDGEEDGNDAGDGDSDVGDEATDSGKRSKENGMRKSDEVKRGRDDGTESEIDGELKQDVAGDAPRGVAHRLRHQS